MIIILSSPQRLEYCVITAQAHKIEYRYPLLDKRLLEFYLALPNHLKRKNGIGRYIARKSGEGILPPEIQWRYDKTGTVIPIIFERYKRDYKKIKEFIEYSRKTVKKHYIDYDKAIERLDLIANYDEKTQARADIQLLDHALMLLLYQLENGL